MAAHSSEFIFSSGMFAAASGLFVFMVGVLFIAGRERLHAVRQVSVTRRARGNEGFPNSPKQVGIMGAALAGCGLIVIAAGIIVAIVGYGIRVL